MSIVTSTAVSAVSRMRGFWLASTALVGIRILPQPAQSVLHVPSSPSLLQARMARLMALAIETPASLLARLNPLRSVQARKVRPAARVGRRRWREAVLAAALLTGASTAHAQTWNGATTDYNTATNWTPNGAPVAAGQSATFANTGSATVNVSAPIAPDAWTFNPNAQSYTITGSQVTFGGAGITDNAAAGTTISIANVIAGTGGVTQAGSGTLVLTGANAYTGGTTVSAGRVIASNTGRGFGSSGTVAISSGATVELNATGNNGYTQAPNTFTGAGTIEKTGTGALTFGGNGGNTNISLSQGGLINVLEGTLGGSSSGQGIWTNNKGSLNVAAGATLNTVEAAVFIDALTGAGTYQSGFAGPRTTTIGVAGGTGTFSGTIRDAGVNDRAVIVKTGAGTQTFSGANTYTGGTTFAGGVLNAGSAGALGTTGTLSFTGGTLQYSAANQTDYSSRFSAGAGQLYSIDTNGQNVTFASALRSSGGSLSKSGTGTLTLTGVNTYTGATTINAGTLALNNAAGTAIANISRVTFGNAVGTAATLQAQTSETIGSLSGGNASSTVNIAAGTTLTVGGDNTTNGTYDGAINANNTGILAKTGTGRQTLTGAMTGGALVANQGTLALGTGGSLNTAGVAGLVPGATGGQAQAAVLVNSGAAMFTNAGTITATNQGVALQGGTFINTGSVTASTQSGVFAPTGAVAIINTGGGSIGGVNGIDANLTSADAISITGNGSVTGTGGFGIRAVSNGGDVVVGTAGAALGAVAGNTSGIIAQTSGAGTVGIVAAGSVTGAGADAINAQTTGTGAASVTLSGTGGTIQGGTPNGAKGAGVRVVTTGSGAGTINVTGNNNTVTGDQPAMLVQTNGSDAAIAVTGTGNTFTGSSGLITNQQGTGAFASTITVANGNTIAFNASDTTDAYNGQGIFAGNQGTGVTSITTGTGSVTGNANGVVLAQANTGNASAVSVITGGNVTGQGGASFPANNATNQPYRTLFTNAPGGSVGASPTGLGVLAVNAGSGTLTVNTSGGTIVSAQDANAIDARNAGGMLTVTNSDALRHADTVTGGSGLNAINTGTGGVTVTNSGAIGAAGGAFTNGIVAYSTTGTGNVGVDNQAGGTIGRAGTPVGGRGIIAYNQNGGAGTVTVGNAAAINAAIGIEANTSGAGTVTVNQTAGTVQATGNGIDARSTGSGAVVINQTGGQVSATTTNSVGINGERNAAGTISITSGTVTSGNEGVRAINFASGNVTVAAQGNITSGGLAINASIFNQNGDTGAGNVVVTTTTGTTLTGGTTGDDRVLNATHAAGGTGYVQVTNNATITRSAGSRGTAISTSNGTSGSLVGTPTSIAIINTGTITNNFANGISAQGAGAGVVTVDNSGGVTVGTLGISATTTGTGAITVGGTGAVTANASIQAYQQGTAGGTNAGVTVSGSGATTANTGIGIDARVTSANNAGNVLVTRSGTVTAGTTGINATTAGAGSVTVGTTMLPVAIGNITAGGIAINATANAGTVTVNTSTGTIQSGTDAAAINATNSGGLITVNNAAALQHATGVNGGTAINAISSGTGGVTVANTGAISAAGGTFINGIVAQATGSAGNVMVTTSAAGTIGSVTAPASGIFATTSGSGNVSVTADGAIRASNQGIRAFSQGTGTGSVSVTGAGAITTLAGGSIGLNAQIANAASAGTILVNTSGAVSTNTIGVRATTAGTGTVTVSAGPITTTNGSGIVAAGTSGAVAVTASGLVQAGGTGNGIFLTGNNAGNTATVAANATVQGAIGLRLAGTGTTTLANSGTIATTGGAGANALQIDGGTLVIGNTPGTLTGNIAIVNATANGANGPSVLTLTNTNAITLANTVTGAGVLNQSGSGTTILNGTNSATNGQFSGTANVNAGILSIGGAGTTGVAFGNTANNSATVNVNAGGTLHGSGTIAGSVNVNGGTVSAGNSPGTLTVAGNYTLNGASTSLYELGAPGVVGGASNDLINVGRNLSLAGTLNLVSATDATAAPVSGAYRLYNYGGTLAGAFGTVSTPTANTTALVYTNIPSQVNVLLTNGGQSVQYFDGADLTGATAGAQGGTGTWNASNTNWTTLPGGQVNDIWRSGVGIFGGTAGTVTVTGAQNLQGVQFTVDGYQLAGTGTLNLTGDPFTTANQSFVNVDQGVGATIANALTSTGGTIGLVKLGAGTLTLTGASSYTGATTVQAGTLAIAAGGSITSNVSNNATFANAGTVTGNLSNAGTAGNTGTITGTVTNSGSFATSGTVSGGLTNLAGTTTNTGTINGGAAILAGTFTTTGIVNGTLSNAGTVNAQGQINGAVANQAGGTFTVTGGLTGIGRLTNDGAVDLGGNDLDVGSLAGSTAAATIANGGTLTTGSDGTSSAYAGQITGATALTKLGAGTLTLLGTSSYTGGTTLNGGTLQVGTDANLGAATGALTFGGGTLANSASFTTTRAVTLTAAGGTISPAANTALTLAGAIGGPGALTAAGNGQVILTGTNTYGGDTLVSTGATLQVGAGGTAGTLPGNVTTNGTLAFNRSDAVTYAGTITGTGSLQQNGTGLLDLTGTNSAANGQFTGTTSLNAGTLALNGVFGDTAANGATLVVNAGTLQGAGTFAGSVTVNGGTVNAGGATGAATGTLSVARDYTLTGGATSVFEFGAPGFVGGSSNDLINVGRNLSLAGTLNLVSATDATAAPVSGAYRLYNYGGTLAGAFGTVSTPTANTTALVYTNIPSQVNVLLTNGGQSVQYFDGADLTGATAGAQGGTGTWNASNTNWTTLPGGQVNDIWRSGVGIFGGTAGTVTVTGAQNLQGVQFTVDGYQLAGTGTLNLTGDPFTTANQSFVNVDQGVGATIANALTSTGGTIGLVKLGAGTLTLTGASSYTGATTVQAGTLAIAAGGSITSNVSNNATFANAGTVTGNLSNAGTAGNTGTITGTVTNSGSFATSGTVSGGLTNTGTVTASAGRIDGAIANNAGTVTVSGQVASNGTLGNASGATLAVSGTGAYGLSGPLTNAGNLTVAAGGSLTAPAGVNNSGSIAVAQGGTVTAALANTGSVVNDGAYNADVSNAASGTIANTASGVWTGNLTANTGSVSNAGQWNGDGRNDAGGSVTNTGTWTTATGPFANAGTLTTSGVLNGGVANTGSVQASGQIVGAVSNGAGASFALTGPLSGVTTFANDGTLDLGGTAFTVGSLSGTNTTATLRNGALTTNGDNSSTAYAGTIVDGAAATSLTKNGTGSLTLTGINTYSGGTTIAAGTLVTTAAGLGSGAITDNAALVINQVSDATLGSAINGTGSFTKQGAGNLTYTGTGTLSGPTTVATGGLVVNGSLAASPVTVASGAFVGGTGTIGGLTVQSGATAAPGASTAGGNPGTLNVAGNVLFAAQSIYQVDATPAGQSDRIAATGTATLQGGTVQVTAQFGLYNPTTSYTILSAAGGVTGRFAGVTSNFAFLTPFLTYGANDATLRLARNDLEFGAVAVTRNQGNVAGAAQATGVGARLYDAIAVLSAPQARQAFDALSGEIHSGAVTSQFATGYLVREAILDRLRFGETPSFGGLGAEGIGQRFAPGTTLPAAYTADLPGRTTAPVPVSTQLVAPNPVAVWGQGFGSFGSIGGDGNSARLDQQTSGFVLGADTRLDRNWRVGAAGGYTFTTLDVTARQSTGTVESGYGALYAGGSFGAVQLRLGGAYAGSSLATNRAVLFPGFSENASARYGGSLGQAFGEVGYRVGSGTGYVEPFVGGAAIRIGRDGFTERGGAAALTGRDQDYDIATSTVGVQAQGQIGDFFGSATPIFVRGLVGYRRAYGDVVPSTLFSFGAAGQTFLTAGVPIARDAMVAQAGLDWQVSQATTLSLAYTGQVGADRTQIHGIKGGFLYRW